jgi:hypothetical protein
MPTKADSHVAGWFKAKTLAEKFLKALNRGALSFKDEFFECVKKREPGRTAHELAEALQQKTAISEILHAISKSPTNAQSVLDTVAVAVARLCDVTHVEIFQAEGDEVRLAAKHGEYRIWPVGHSLRISRELVVGRTVADATSVHVPDLQAAEADFPQGAAYARQYGIEPSSPHRF